MKRPRINDELFNKVMHIGGGDKFEESLASVMEHLDASELLNEAFRAKAEAEANLAPKKEDKPISIPLVISVAFNWIAIYLLLTQ